MGLIQTCMQQVEEAVQGLPDQTTEQEPSVDDRISILILNDYCLLNILSFLKLKELLKMEKVCERFKDVAQIIYQTYQVLDLTKDSSSIEVVSEIFRRVGGSIHTLKISKNSVTLPQIELGQKDTVQDFLNKYCKNLKNIHLDGFELSNHRSKDNMVAVCRDVKVVKLTNCRLTNGTLMSMLDLNHLEVLELCYGQINGDCLSSLNNMRELSLEGYDNVDPQLFIKYCEQHPNLQNLNIMFCKWVNDTCLQSIAANFIELEKIAISTDMFDVSTQDYVVLANLPKVTHLKVYYWRCLERKIEEMLLKFSAQEHLNYLDIIIATPSPNTENIVETFTELKGLHMDRTCTNSTLASLSGTPTLQRLNIRSSEVTSFCLERLIAKCPAIELIDVRGCSKLDESCIPSILNHIKERSHMLELKIYDDRFSKETLKKYAGSNPFKLKLSTDFLLQE